ncbi:site-2 protease family protein [Candidatus Nomurabacteria bacterium]|nr:site-2 protease family protein [Candidatus Nomurabacteria bacterium]
MPIFIMNAPLSLFYFLVLIFSIIVHEVAHGIAAEKEGDSTARLLGRITLNPIPHIDLFGSIILPLILILSHAGFVVGWAKPVPYDERNLRNGRRSVAKVAIAGIVVNLTIALVFGIFIRILFAVGIATPALIEIVSIVVLMNLVLALFNAIPIAPLDGFRFLSVILPIRAQPAFRLLEQWSLPLLIAFLFLGWKYVVPLVFFIYQLLTGIAL